MESGRHLLHPEDIDLSELVKDSAAKLRNRFPRKEIREQIDEKVNYSGDRLLLQLLFNNLIENAIKYSPANTPVTVSLERKAGSARFQVEDHGIGIPAEEKNKIFEKFYRTGNENTRQTKGTGLGLYLSQMIAIDHGSRITVRDNQPSGSIFTVEFIQHA
jgi:signal transduction histidine kinase